MVNGAMKKRTNPTQRVSGIIAPAPRLTLLGAALIAVIISFPVGVTLLVMDLLLL
jgi:hypothetical protein